MGNTVSGTVILDPSGRLAIFAPSQNLDYDNGYIATIQLGVRDLAGNSIPSDKAWSFNTEPLPPLAAPSIESPADGSFTKANPVPISGTTDSGTTVKVTIDSGTLVITIRRRFCQYL
jgi:type IV pilus assembly protein PilY1